VAHYGHHTGIIMWMFTLLSKFTNLTLHVLQIIQANPQMCITKLI
jgi:hypothetical protein